MKLTEPQVAALTWAAKNAQYGGWRLWYGDRHCASRVALEALVRKGMIDRDEHGGPTTHYYRATEAGRAALAAALASEETP